MEELQLTLTPSRVDQRNHGIMLANWRVGQVINALVSERMPSGALLLSVGSQSFVTSRDIPVQPGARLQFEVDQVTPELRLRLLNSSLSGEHAVSDRAVTMESLHKGKVVPIASLPSFLSSLVKLTATNDSVILTRPELNRLLNDVALNVNNITPEKLSLALRFSGLFTEAFLLASRPDLAKRSIKSFFLMLKERILKSSRAAGLSPAERQSLVRLMSSLDTLMSKTTYQQIGSIPNEDLHLKWLTTVPLRWGDNFFEIDVDLRRRPLNQVPNEDQWHFNMCMELPSLGPLEVEIISLGQRLNVEIKVSDALAGTVDAALVTLRSQLATAGLVVEKLIASPLESNKPMGEEIKQHVDLHI